MSSLGQTAGKTSTVSHVPYLQLNPARLSLPDDFPCWKTCTVFFVFYLQLKPAEHVSQYVTSHPGQLNLAIPLWVGAMSTSQRVVCLAVAE